MYSTYNIIKKSTSGNRKTCYNGCKRAERLASYLKSARKNLETSWSRARTLKTKLKLSRAWSSSSLARLGSARLHPYLLPWLTG
ncbi:hypothetical protein Hanom_Chr17g01526911 [Helianthus anomalus]